MGTNFMNKKVHKDYIRILAEAFFIIIASLILNHIAGGKFLTLFNLKFIIVGATIPTFTAWGLSFIFASNITDFSIGAVIILAATVTGTLGNLFGLAGVLVGGMAVGFILLLINFQVYNITKITSWIAGMGMAMIYESITVIYSNSRLKNGLQVIQLDDDKKIFGQPPAINIILIIGLIAAYVVYNKTTIGLNVRALGSNQEVSKMMGINVSKTLLLGGLIAGAFFGASGFLTESYAGRAIAATGLTSIATIFQPLAAVLLAQVMEKYINLMIAIPVATIIITAIFNVLTLLGVPSGTLQQTFLGVIVIIFGILAQRGEKGVVK
ncbi:hypothetical protein M2651_02855 [Clostridium sp. SYSU_GA19001]|uniref:ABC transporter permease n=1 Tax=Clostridium caldaquaticum TaxID=2940653 RepID=UPI0020778654|nr:hypothetical protein [Clostridium caldaquaticum]MCM8709964.1 hypothetical protein [Clostridium caldaquaticum]